jgi:hypothetical protein
LQEILNNQEQRRTRSTPLKIMVSPVRFRVPGQVWLENYNPPQIDSEANLKAGQLIFSGSGTPQEAAQLWQSVAQRWRTQNPDDLKNWQNWHPEVSGA